MDQLSPNGMEFDWRPTLLVATLIVVGSIIGVVAFQQSNAIFTMSLLGGIAAGLGSGYYQQSSNNAVMGVIIAMPVYLVFLTLFQAAYFPGSEPTGDALFFIGAQNLVWLIVLSLVLIPLAYIGSFIGDFLKKRIRRRTKKGKESPVGKTLGNGQKNEN